MTAALVSAAVLAVSMTAQAAGSFSTVASPNPGTNYDEIDAVAAVTASDAWAVGFQRSPLCQTRMRHRSEANLLLSRARQEPPRRDYDDDRHGVGRYGA